MKIIRTFRLSSMTHLHAGVWSAGVRYTIAGGDVDISIQKSCGDILPFTTISHLFIDFRSCRSSIIFLFHINRMLQPMSRYLFRTNSKFSSTSHVILTSTRDFLPHANQAMTIYAVFTIGRNSNFPNKTISPSPPIQYQNLISFRRKMLAGFQQGPNDRAKILANRAHHLDIAATSISRQQVTTSKHSQKCPSHKRALHWISARIRIKDDNQLSAQRTNTLITDLTQ